MLRTDMTEARTGVINCGDVCGKAMESFLYYIYTGKLMENWKDPEVICDFLLAAHKYQLQSLVKYLNENISKVCNIKTTCKLLVLAKTLDLKVAEKELTVFVSGYIRTASIREIADLKDLLGNLQGLNI